MQMLARNEAPDFEKFPAAPVGVSGSYMDEPPEPVVGNVMSGAIGSLDDSSPTPSNQPSSRNGSNRGSRRPSFSIEGRPPSSSINFSRMGSAPLNGTLGRGSTFDESSELPIATNLISKRRRSAMLSDGARTLSGPLNMAALAALYGPNATAAPAQTTLAPSLPQTSMTHSSNSLRSSGGAAQDGLFSTLLQSMGNNRDAIEREQSSYPSERRQSRTGNASNPAMSSMVTSSPPVAQTPQSAMTEVLRCFSICGQQVDVLLKLNQALINDPAGRISSPFPPPFDVSQLSASVQTSLSSLLSSEVVADLRTIRERLVHIESLIQSRQLTDDVGSDVEVLAQLHLLAKAESRLQRYYRASASLFPQLDLFQNYHQPQYRSSWPLPSSPIDSQGERPSAARRNRLSVEVEAHISLPAKPYQTPPVIVITVNGSETVDFIIDSVLKRHNQTMSSTDDRLPDDRSLYMLKPGGLNEFMPLGCSISQFDYVRHRLRDFASLDLAIVRKPAVQTLAQLLRIDDESLQLDPRVVYAERCAVAGVALLPHTTDALTSNINCSDIEFAQLPTCSDLRPSHLAQHAYQNIGELARPIVIDHSTLACHETNWTSIRHMQLTECRHPFRVRICGLERVNTSILPRLTDKHQQLFVRVCLFHGTRLIRHSLLQSEDFAVSNAPRIMQWLTGSDQAAGVEQNRTITMAEEAAVQDDDQNSSSSQSNGARAHAVRRRDIFLRQLPRVGFPLSLSPFHA